MIKIKNKYKNMIKPLQLVSDLDDITAVQFEDFGKAFGITPELLEEVRNLQNKLSKAKYGRY